MDRTPEEVKLICAVAISSSKKEVLYLRWRLVELEELGAREAMALEEVVMEQVSEGGDPVIHFWKWREKAVTIGSFQIAEDEVYLDRARKMGVPVIRRVSGGGTMFHVPGGEFVYSLCAPPGVIMTDITASYRQLLGPIVDALIDLGLDPAMIENNIMIGDRKISGSAQRRMASAILHHGTLLHDVNQFEMFSMIKGDKAPSHTRGVCSNYKPVTCILDHLDMNLDSVYEKVRDRILTDMDWYLSNWSEEERYRAMEIGSQKYSREDWNLKL
ncbi:MAG: biotin/lipoate A/B protein ligase family protein [Thermoplasmatota archaeon]